MKNLLVLGIMSGTSIDRTDFALCQIAGKQVQLGEHWSVEFPATLQGKLHQAARGVINAHELAQLHHDLGRFYAAGALHSKRKPQLIGLHGQTIYHQPLTEQPATFQAGEPAYLVEALRVPVVNNFRAGDLAAGGQGAPLAAIFHRTVFAQPGIHVCVHNLGGISNVTSIDARQRGDPTMLAFDTGPANVLLDLAMRHFTQGAQAMDQDGLWAARGRVDESLLNRWLAHPFFAQAPPKSTGREMFGEMFFRPVVQEIEQAQLSGPDALATLTELTARSIALNYRMHLPSLPQTVILAGGGAANPVLARSIEGRLRELAPDIYVVDTQEFGWPLQTIEPAAFAYLAYLRFHGKTSNLPETTGARRAVSLGQLTDP